MFDLRTFEEYSFVMRSPVIVIVLFAAWCLVRTPSAPRSLTS